MERGAGVGEYGLCVKHRAVVHAAGKVCAGHAECVTYWLRCTLGCTVTETWHLGSPVWVPNGDGTSTLASGSP